MVAKSRATKRGVAKKVLAKAKMKKVGGGIMTEGSDSFKPSPMSPTLPKSGSGS